MKLETSNRETHELREISVAQSRSRILRISRFSQLQDSEVAFHKAEYQRLRVELQAAHDASTVPELPSDETRAALNDLLVRVRISGLKR
jgi:hypothetical protein